MGLLPAGVALHETDFEDPEVAGFAPEFTIRCISLKEDKLIGLQHALNRITAAIERGMHAFNLSESAPGTD